eukprot:jgi/Mesvir1/25572/Mv01805-RA.1
MEGLEVVISRALPIIGNYTLARLQRTTLTWKAFDIEDSNGLDSIRLHSYLKGAVAIAELLKATARHVHNQKSYSIRQSVKPTYTGNSEMTAAHTTTRRIIDAVYMTDTCLEAHQVFQMGKHSDFVGTSTRRIVRNQRYDPYGLPDEHTGKESTEREFKLYVGNLDRRLNEYLLIKLFEPFGKIKREEFMWHTHGPRRGEPRGFAFVEYYHEEDAKKAQKEMNGRLACGRPLIVRFSDEKVYTHNDAPMRQDLAAQAGGAAGGAQGGASGSADGGAAAASLAESNAVSKEAKIAAIRQKLRMMEQEDAAMRQASRQANVTPMDMLPPDAAAKAALAASQAKQYLNRGR